MQKKSTLKKVRVKISNEEYFTNDNWPSKEIDGVKFIAVDKNMPVQGTIRPKFWLRKDSIDYVK